MNTIVQSTALEAGHIISAAPGTLLTLTVLNTKSSSQYIQIHNSATAASNGDVPVFIYPATTATTIEIDKGTNGVDFSAGIYVCNSSTAATRTVGTTDCFFTAVIR
jgi:hypothetical protein